MNRRFRQVWFYLTGRPTEAALRQAAQRLTPAEMALFSAMGAPDQAHGIRVAERLAAIGAPRDVVAAGYLHDAGKPRGFGLFWRTFAVLWPGPRPEPAPPAGRPWQRARQIYHWHGHYAAAALERTGASPRLTSLVRGEARDDWATALRQADDLG